MLRDSLRNLRLTSWGISLQERVCLEQLHSDKLTDEFNSLPWSPITVTMIIYLNRLATQLAHELEVDNLSHSYSLF